MKSEPVPERVNESADDEFGQKVAVATTNGGNWMVAAKLLPDNPYDGHTLAETWTTMESVTGVLVTDA